MTESAGFFATVDEVLLARAKRGERPALARLYREFEVPVYTLARRLCGSREVAEEVAQEAFLAAFRGLHRLRGDGAFGAWLRRVVASKAIDHMRRERGPWDREPDGSSGGESREPPPLDERVDLERALAQLPSLARAVVWLHDVEGLTHGEIAELAGSSVSFSKSQLARAHLRLRESLDGKVKKA